MARSLIAGVFGVVALVGCAEAAPPSLDEASVRDAVPAAVFPDEPELLADLDCESPAEEVIAQTIGCTASLHGDPVTIDIAIDDEANAVPTLNESIVDLSTIESAAGERLSVDLGLEVVVTCPGSFRVERPAMEVDCEAMHDQRPLLFVARRDSSGETWSFDYVTP